MPYNSINDLPENVANVLPAHAQAIFVEAFNHAYEEYKNPEDRRGDESRENVARKVAWSAVKKKYEKGNDGKWKARAE
jgi:cation transport regulator